MQNRTITTKVIQLVKQVYDISAELTSLTGRPFTPDGHMVGSAGEVLAAFVYDLELLPQSTEAHDACKGDVLVQVKATGCDRVALSSKPQHLLVLKLDDGKPTEIYNGPGALAWAKAGKLQKNGQRQISVACLKKLMGQVPSEQQLERVRSLR